MSKLPSIIKDIKQSVVAIGSTSPGAKVMSVEDILEVALLFQKRDTFAHAHTL